MAKRGKSQKKTLLSLNCVLPCTKYLKLITYFKVKSYEHYPILASFNALGETLEDISLMKLDLCLPPMLPILTFYVPKTVCGNRTK